MNSLKTLFDSNQDRIIHKWDHYFDIYESHFSRYRGKDVVILEIGIAQGGSLRLWKNYFGKGLKLYAIDIDPRCKDFEEDGVEIFIGSQSDRKFLREVISKIPKIDILIDDGGHTMKQQIVSFEELFDHIKQDGIYFCEDCHTSYWWEFGGGYKRSGSFIEYSKNWIDKLNAYHSRSSRLKVDKFTRSVRSAHFYDSIVVLQKAVVNPPFDLRSGTESFKDEPQSLKFREKIAVRVRPIWKRITAFLGLPYHLE